jgi:hypothetical protein
LRSQAQALGLLYGFLEWRTLVWHNLTPIPAEDRVFWQRYVAAHAASGHPALPWHDFGSSRARVEVFIRQERQAFEAQVDQQRPAYDALLVPLEHQMPARLWHLLFIPGIVVPFCTAVQRYWQQVRKEIVKEKQRLNYLSNKHIAPLQHYPLFSETAKQGLQGLQQESAVLLALFQAELERPPLEQWTVELGISKNESLEKQKQRLWSIVFEELVDLLHPFCIAGSPKRLHLKTTPGAMPEKVFTVASRLMHLAQPDLWPDNATLVKNRYHASKRQRRST